MSEKIKSNDYVWIHVDHPTNMMIISGFLEFAKPLSYEKLGETIERRMLIYKRFKKRIAKPFGGIGPAYWEEDPYFDLRSHVHRIALPKSGGKAELQEMVSNLMISPLDPTKPLWHMYLIENYGKGCLLLVRLHHSVGDGISLIHVLLSITDNEPNPAFPHRKDKAEGRPFATEGFYPINTFKKHASSVLRTTQKLSNLFVKEGSKILADADHRMELTNKTTSLAASIPKAVARMAFMSPDSKTVLKGELGVRKRAVWSEQIPLGDIKKIGKALNATLNDVLVSALTGSLRYYLESRNNPVADLELRMIIPVSVRQPGKDFALGNQVSLVFLVLPVYIDSPAERLKETKRRMDELKESPEITMGFIALGALGKAPLPIAKKAGTYFSDKATAVMSNVPGPKKAIYLAGTKVKNIMFWAPRTGRMGLGLSIISYDDQVTLGIAVDEGLVPDPEVIIEGFLKEFSDLLALAQA